MTGTNLDYRDEIHAARYWQTGRPDPKIGDVLVAVYYDCWHFVALFSEGERFTLDGNEEWKVTDSETFAYINPPKFE